MSNFPQPFHIAASQLAQELGVPVEEVKLVKFRQVLWADTSLGHDEPGGVYVMMNLPGFQVVFEVAGVGYAYHTDAEEQVKRVA